MNSPLTKRVLDLKKQAEANRKKRERSRKKGSLPNPQAKQKEFLETEADIALYGGAAGSGKSLALLLDFAKSELLKFPYYGGVIFRRTYPEIKNEGGLWDESGNWYPEIGAIANESRLIWKFPSGATIRFSHLQHEKDVYRWQGAQLPRVGLDEATHFTRKQFIYLLSRMRSPQGLRPKMRATCNPDAESWLADFINWYINPQGFPYPERSGVIRYFIVQGDEVIWGDSVDSLRSRYPGCKPKSFTFISAKITDNPALLDKDPDYLANLEAQDPVERARLLDGNWRVKRSESLLFNKQAIVASSSGLWLSPQPNKRYLIGVDPNFGGDKHFVCQVWDIKQRPYRLVHQYREREQVIVSSIEKVAAIARKYPPYLLAVEINTGGKIVAERLMEKLPGVKICPVLTSEGSKKINTDRIAIALEEGLIQYPADWSGIEEMRAFSKTRRRAITGYDDSILAWAVAFAYLEEALAIATVPERINPIVGSSLV